jgi:tetratricopeptide (TPR) repeat protein
MPIGTMAIAAALVFSATGATQAQGSRNSRFAEARRACASGQLERGIQLLADLIAENNDAAAIYYQARCYQENGRPEQALARFQEFLRLSPNLSARGRDEVTTAISRLEYALAEKTRQESLAARTARAPTPPADGELLSRSGYWRIPTRRELTVATATVGVVALAGSVYFGLRAHGFERDIERQSRFQPVAEAEFQRRYQQGKRAASWQVISTVVAALALGQSAVLHFLYRRPTDEPLSPAVVRF